MKAGIPSQTRKPFKAPRQAPTAITAMTTRLAVSPSVSQAEVRQDTSATIAPTERSMPAVAMTKVEPTPIMMIGAVCRATLSRLMVVRK